MFLSPKHPMSRIVIGKWFVAAFLGLVLATTSCIRPAAAQEEPTNCNLARTITPAFLHDPAINPNAAQWTGAIAIVSQSVTEPVLQIFNLTDQDSRPLAGTTMPQPYIAPVPLQYAPAAWSGINTVYGITLDTDGNIYLASNSTFDPIFQSEFPDGAGVVYKVDTATGVLSNFFEVPGDGTSGETLDASLGNISTNLDNNDIFVSSLDTGLIYRYSVNGVLQETFDHGLSRVNFSPVTTGTNFSNSTLEPIANEPTFVDQGAMTIKGRRVIAVEVYNGRVYYSVAWRYNNQPPQATDFTDAPYTNSGININDEELYNQIWSVGLNADGSIDDTDVHLEFSLAQFNPYNATWSHDENDQEVFTASKWPIGDITFLGDGRMLVAERPHNETGGYLVVVHDGQVIEATPNGSAWSLDATAFDGFGQTVIRNDSMGGVSWDPTALNGAGRVWLTGEGLWAGPFDPDGTGPLNPVQGEVFGISGIPDDGAAQDSAWFSGLFIDTNGDYSTQSKGTGGDVEVACGIAAALVSLGSFVWEDQNRNGLQDPGEPGISGATVALLDGTGSPANDADGNPVASQPTGADGLYFFDNLLEGDYIVQVTPPIQYAPSATQSTGVINGSTNTNVTENDSNVATEPTSGTYRSGVITLTADSEPVESNTRAGDNQDSELDANGNMTVDFGFYVQGGALTISKVLNSVEPVRLGDPVSFTIAITSTGDVAIDLLPLNDTYDRDYLHYEGATPNSDDNVDDGSIDWSDLTAASPNGFGSNLEPGQTISIVVDFTALRDTSHLPNQSTVNIATVSGAEDIFGAPVDPASDDDDVQILGPTAVYFVDHDVTRIGRLVVLRWTTLDETNIAAFRIVRTNADGTDAAPLGDLIPAMFAGTGSGARYSYADVEPINQSVAHYNLEVLLTNGTIYHLHLGSVSPQAVLYLPLITR